MTTKLIFSQDCIILDACCVINLYASGQMGNILQSIAKVVAVAAYVRDEEAQRIYAGDGTQKYEKIDLQPFIDSGLLTVVSPETEAEDISFVNFAAILGGDGEAVTAAIALHRNWSIGSDDRKAISFFVQNMPQVQIITTPELLRYWVDAIEPSSEMVRIALQNIRRKARYEPHPKHPLCDWWRANR